MLQRRLSERRLDGLPVLPHQHRSRGLDPVLFLGGCSIAQSQNPIGVGVTDTVQCAADRRLGAVAHHGQRQEIITTNDMDHPTHKIKMGSHFKYELTQEWYARLTALLNP